MLEHALTIAESCGWPEMHPAKSLYYFYKFAMKIKSKLPHILYYYAWQWQITVTYSCDNSEGYLPTVVFN